MKIAFHLNCLEHGGAERVVSNLANQFAREGHEVFVTTQSTSDTKIFVTFLFLSL